MKASRPFRTVAILALAVLAGLVLLRWYYSPSGSDNMLLVTDRTPVQAIVVCSDTGEVLWRVVSAARAEVNPQQVPYGSVPVGFVQEVPSTGGPRPFRRGEHLQVHVLSATRDMGDAGKATGAREFLTVVNFSGPRPLLASQVECKRAPQ